MRPYFYLGNGRGLTQLSTGELFYVDTVDRSITPWLLLGGYWETFVDDVLCALARPGGTFVDVGANMGYYTIKIGTKVGPQGRVYSFEPNPEMFGLLRDNVVVNAHAARATLFEAAAGAVAGPAWLNFQRSAPGGGRIELDGSGHDTRVEVSVVRVDDVLPGDCVADLIKIDVEGFEPLALAGMEALLARSPNAALVVEVTHDQWARFGDPPAMLRAVAAGRRVFRIYTDGLLTELGDDIDQALDRDFVSYVLLLPPTPEAWERIRPFTAQGRAEAAATPVALQEAAPDAASPAAPAAPPPRRGRIERGFRRMLGLA
jgi:FkbM family methyltransferase